jgi:predicted alpha/beta-fold hydrolase
MTVSYRPPLLFRNGHIHSIYPSLFRKVEPCAFERERIITPDNDFLDLDWLRSGNPRLVILSHGLEGHSRRPYIQGMAHAAGKQNWDVLAWNYRGCSGEPNNHIHAYHSGKTEDLEQVIRHAVHSGYQEIGLIGFSIGGNKTLLHIGREKDHLAKEVIAAVALSVPCDLQSSSYHLAKWTHSLYMQNFLNSFKQKLKQKMTRFPDKINLSGFHKIRNFKQFDERYTAPMNGFASAEDYWFQSSCLHYLEGIRIPALIINALDDPFLPPECFPVEQAKMNSKLTLEMPRYGGHIGFMPGSRDSLFYSEQRALSFLAGFSRYSEPSAEQVRSSQSGSPGR